MKITAHIIFIFVNLFFFGGISAAQELETSQPTEGTETYLNGRWELTNLDNEIISANFFSNGVPYIAINIKDRTLTGSTGCNSFTGKVTSEGEKINIENIFSTEMACEYQKDKEIFDALENCNNYFIDPDNGILTLKSDNAVRAVFKKSTATGNTERDSLNQKMFEKGVGFYASGHEPYWTAEFKGAGSLVFDFNHSFEVTEYKLLQTFNDLRSDSITIIAENDGDEIIIRILKRECTDIEHGKKFPYEIKLNIDDMLYTGCGDFTAGKKNLNETSGAYMINDIWVMEKLGDEELVSSEFKTGLPLIELNIKKNNFMGNTGCNKMNGTMLNVGKLIKFNSIVTTKMMCPGNYDSRIISALKESDNFEIEELRLYLKKGDKLLAVFRKID